MKRGICVLVVILLCAVAHAVPCIYVSNTSVSGNITCDGDFSISSGVTLTVSNVTQFIIPGNATIQTNALVDGNGRGFAQGAGPGGATGDNGGTHGGMGGLNNDATYGSATQPRTRGSGGGATAGNPGGAAVEFQVTGTFTNNGIIDMEGGGEPTDAVGGGAGGSIFVNATSISGSGIYTAEGGDANPGGNDGAGGGGRIAIWANNANDIDPANIDVSAGTAGDEGTDGTLFLYDKDDNSIFIKERFRFEAEDFNGTFTYEQIRMTNATVEYEGNTILQVANFTMDSLSSLSSEENTAHNLTINASNIINITSLSASLVSLTSPAIILQGGTISTNNRGYAADEGPGGAGSDDGGSYGGNGGGGSGGVFYGSALVPLDFGSAATLTTTRGGGSIQIRTDNLTLAGTLTSNGGSTGSSQGGPAGGSIFINASTINGNATLTANGAPAIAGNDGSGGGGRIAIWTTDTSSLNTSTWSAAGGVGGIGDGDNGTIVLIDTDESILTGTKYFRFEDEDFSLGSPFDVIILENATSEHDINASLEVNRFTMDDTSSLTGVTNLNRNLTINATVNITVSSIATSLINLSAPQIRILSGSLLSVAGRGFDRGEGPGAAAGDEGGAYGGNGGGPSGGSYYGSALTPLQFGSGTGSSGSSLGTGGGSIQIRTNQLDLAGILNASGRSTTNGGPAGGSIFINATTINGNATLYSNGGDGTGSGDGGGSGGRIAVWATNAHSLTRSNWSVDGGSGATGNGGPGTIALIDSDDSSIIFAKNFRFQQNDFLSGTPFTTIEFDNASVEYENIPTLNVSTWFMDDTSSLTAIQTQDSNITINATQSIVAASISASLVRLEAPMVNLTNNATLDSVGRGFARGEGPGVAGLDDGGAYGGDGGASLGGDEYGSALVPLEFGSGTGPSGSSLGTGGGSVQIRAPTIHLAGTINVTGGSTGNGAGAGGSIFINATTVTGNISLVANGGVGSGPNDGGGGGGRIAVWANNAHQLNTSTWAATGGIGTAGNGEDGTIALIDTDGASLLAVKSFRFETDDFGSASPFDFIELRESISETETISLTSLETFTMDEQSSITGTRRRTTNLTIAATTLTLHNVTLSKLNASSTTLTLLNGTLISTSGRGFGQGQGPGVGTGDKGGAHGGAGGGAGGGSEYGSALMPTTFGSGTTSGTSIGGGSIILSGGTVTINGILNSSADFGAQGGAAGGSINIQATTLLGNASLYADGETSLASGDGGGSGGRIAINAQDTTVADSWTLQANGGLGTSGDGAPGTIVLISNETILPRDGFRIEDEDMTNNILSAKGILLENRSVDLDTGTTLNLSSQLQITNGSIEGNGLSLRVQTPSVNLTNATFRTTATDIRYSSTFSDLSTVYEGTQNIHLEDTNYASINWISVTNATNLSQHVTIVDNLVRVNSSAAPELNTSATITLRTSFTKQPEPKWDPEDDGTFVPCPPSVCTVLSFNTSTGLFIFNVTQFSGFSSGFDSTLSIYDDNDPEGGSQARTTGQIVNFFANYTNSTSNEAITASCTISIPGINVTNSNMSFNTSGQNLHQFSTVFSNAATYNWSTNCTNVVGFENLSATDDIIIGSLPEAIPEFSDFLLIIAISTILGGCVVMRRRE